MVVNTLLSEQPEADSGRVNGTNESRGLKADRDFLFRHVARGVFDDGRVCQKSPTISPFLRVISAAKTD